MIIDASVASHWFVQTEFSEAANAFRTSDQLIAPGFLLIETANVLYKRSRKGEIPPESCLKSIAALRRSLSALISDEELLPRAMAIALDTLTPIYDCLYISLAIDRNDRIATADRRLAAVAGRLALEAILVEPA
jgi:predicted nucleic acid-binding protein